MVASVEISLDEGSLRRIERMLADVPRGLPKVVSRALNKVAGGARTEVVKAVVDRVGLKVSRLRQKNVLLRRATYRRWIATILITGGRIPLIDFQARQVRRGVSFLGRRSAGRQMAEQAFIATMPSGHKGVYRRRADSARPSGRTPRLPIDELKGASIPTLVDDIDRLSARRFQRRLDRDLVKELDRQVGVLLKGGG